MPIITIPKTIEDAKAALGGIGALLTAKQWERAAIVFAFTRSDIGGGPRHNRVETTQLPCREFAETMGVRGLGEKQVREYRKAWESAAAEIGNDDMLAIQPGDGIDMPDPMPTWKDHFGEPTKEVQERVARSYIALNPQVAVEAIKAVPAVAAAVVAAVVDDATLAEQHARVSAHKAHTGVTRDPGAGTPANIPTYEREKDLMKAIVTVTKAIAEEAAGTYTIDPGSTVLLFILTRELNERATRIIGAQPVIHSEIDAFLASARKED